MLPAFSRASTAGFSAAGVPDCGVSLAGGFSSAGIASLAGGFTLAGVASLAGCCLLNRLTTGSAAGARGRLARRVGPGFLPGSLTLPGAVTLAVSPLFGVSDGAGIGAAVLSVAGVLSTESRRPQPTTLRTPIAAPKTNREATPNAGKCLTEVFPEGRRDSNLHTPRCSQAPPATPCIIGDAGRQVKLVEARSPKAVAATVDESDPGSTPGRCTSHPAKAFSPRPGLDPVRQLPAS